MSKTEEVQEKSVLQKRETERLKFGIPRFSLTDLKHEIELAETQGRKDDLRMLQSALPAKEADAHQKRIEQSKRAIAACERSGTPEQLVEEQARLEQYLANPPNVVS